MIGPALLAAAVAANPAALQFDSTWQHLAKGTPLEGMSGDVRVGFGPSPAADGGPAGWALTLRSDAVDYQGLALGGLDVDLIDRGGDQLTEGRAVLRTDLADKAEVEFALDLQLGPFLDGLRWGRRSFEAVAMVQGVDLAKLTEQVPLLAATGKLDVLLSVGGIA